MENLVSTKYFSYEKDDYSDEFYELLASLMENWENEVVEFKEAKVSFDFEQTGYYFSALSNEANLRGQRCGWLVFGVSEQKVRHVVGTSFKQGDKELLEEFKLKIANGITDRITFRSIKELFPVVDGEKKRVLMFQIPAAPIGLPVSWKNRYWGRVGESLLSLSQDKLDEIRRQVRSDWSAQFVDGASLDSLDKVAIALARQRYAEKMRRPHISEEIAELSDEEFLEKLQLIRQGKVTNAAMLLLGRADCDRLLSPVPKVMWRLLNKDGGIKDYEIFSIPFISVADKIFHKIRNLTYRYMPNPNTLFPTETDMYDDWLLRELLNNCLAHSNYGSGQRIYVDEMEDEIEFSNPGEFIPRCIENVLQKTYRPPFYRNPLLADAMVNFDMIDTASSGIKRVFMIQRNKFFPMPDYNLENESVVVKVYGKVLNEEYTQLLFERPDLTIEDIVLLDKVQKHVKLPKGVVNSLREKKLVEGRVDNLIISAEVAQKLHQEVNYIKKSGLGETFYIEAVKKLIRTFGYATRKQVDDLLIEQLPTDMSDIQKKNKIRNLLQKMRNCGEIVYEKNGAEKKSVWVLK